MGRRSPKPPSERKEKPLHDHLKMQLREVRKRYDQDKKPWTMDLLIHDLGCSLAKGCQGCLSNYEEATKLQLVQVPLEKGAGAKRSKKEALYSEVTNRNGLTALFVEKKLSSVRWSEHCFHFYCLSNLAEKLVMYDFCTRQVSIGDLQFKGYTLAIDLLRECVLELRLMMELGPDATWNARDGTNERLLSLAYRLAPADGVGLEKMFRVGRDTKDNKKALVTAIYSWMGQIIHLWAGMYHPRLRDEMWHGKANGTCEAKRKLLFRKECALVSPVLWAAIDLFHEAETKCFVLLERVRRQYGGGPDEKPSILSRGWTQNNSRVVPRDVWNIIMQKCDGHVMMTLVKSLLDTDAVFGRQMFEKLNELNF